ncbi:1-aminocyclopropane-1-carboxylate deaminase/D-cysteine desulfhydrase [Chryseolinea lacunae]|uniref:1-aminocyclopropane-1-carboxylate deaminase/D-cysteine desulfhydrase n=1 Tax=Chryseolinea lacunae TaxID=2801331 RepID=A0ABS1KRE2_9BACT|nr:pyridoxal-phosphate dependent enzyme [Chryseolinea lacunae]MBL0741827.1 1-aminocyclopropane-1-carboxylate deaminase/D-cysteine desulfhydrase [Chryseolinea lacunae]
MATLSYRPTPVHEIRDPLLATAGVQLFVKREDLNHPLVSGNKWWKLKYNLENVSQHLSRTVLTFGGAYSNHIFAVAAAARELGFTSIGVIRGEETLPLNTTLQFAREQGMHLHYVSRDDYRKKEDYGFLEALAKQFGSFVAVPEGGTNIEAVRGVTEFAETLDQSFNYYCCPVGTGGTLAGIIRGVPDTKKVIGFSVLKGEGSLQHDISQWNLHRQNWQLLTDYHFGGYAKSTPALLQFIEAFKTQHGVPLEFVYTGKMMAGIFDLVKKGFFERGSTLLALHTGGLQGKY